MELKLKTAPENILKVEITNTNAQKEALLIKSACMFLTEMPKSKREAKRGHKNQPQRLRRLSF